MFGKSVLVTGCDSGIGLSLCNSLPEKGYFVIAGCKTEQGKKEVDLVFSNLNSKLKNSRESQEGVKYSTQNDNQPKTVGISVLVDISDDQSVKNLVSFYSSQNEFKQIPDLYAVVNNAAIWRFSNLEVIWFKLLDVSTHQESLLNAENTQEELDRWKCVFDTNLMGHVRVTLFFLPFLKKFPGTPKPRIVFISSAVDEVGIPCQSSYVSSKFALRGFHECLLHELLHTNVYSVCIAPGALRVTKLFDLDFDDLDIDKTYKLPETLKLKNGLRRLRKLSPSHKRVVKTIVKALDSKKPRMYYRNTAGTLLFKVIKFFPKWAYLRIVDVILRNMDGVCRRLENLHSFIKYFGKYLKY